MKTAENTEIRRDCSGSPTTVLSEVTGMVKAVVQNVTRILLLLAAIAAFALSERDLFQDILIFYLFCFKCQQK